MRDEGFDEVMVQLSWETFIKFDLEGTGQLNSADARELLRRLKVEVTDEEFHELFTRLDQDGDNKLDFREFMRVFVRGGGAPLKENSALLKFRVGALSAPEKTV